MSLLSRAVDKAYLHRAIHLMEAEHLAWVATATTGTTYWTLAPALAAADNVMTDAYDIHYEYTFTKKWPGWLGMANGRTSLEVWRDHGPLTPVPQQTQRSWEAAHRAGHRAELTRMQLAVAQQAQAELRRLYPESTAAFAGAR